MGLRLSHVALWVADQEEALRWFTEALGFEKRRDVTSTASGFRWLTVAPPGQQGPEVVLVRADPGGEGRAPPVGANPVWVLTTDDCRGTYRELSARGVKFLRPPEETPGGLSATFVDLYGNPYNLLEPRRPEHRPAAAPG